MRSFKLASGDQSVSQLKRRTLAEGKGSLHQGRQETRQVVTFRLRAVELFCKGRPAACCRDPGL